MSVVFTLLLLISFGALLLGLIKPSIVIRWGEETTKKRGKVLLYYGLTTLLLFCFVGATAPKSASENKPKTIVMNQKTTAKTESETTKTENKEPKTQKPEPAKKEIRWNTWELDANKNRNMYTAAEILNGSTFETIKQQAVEVASGDVYKDPKAYYGKAVKFKAYIGKIFVYPKGSKEAKTMGAGEEVNQVYLITDDDTVYLCAIIIGSLKGHKKEELIEFYGMPVGRTNVEAMGKEFLTVVGRME